MSRPLRSASPHVGMSSGVGVGAAPSSFGVGGIRVASTKQSRPSSVVLPTRPSARFAPHATATNTPLPSSSLTATKRLSSTMRGSGAGNESPTAIMDMANFTQSHGSFHGAKEGLEEPAALENEYIVNLQQQVYFLELELNLLKKAGCAGGSAAAASGLRGAGADSGDANVPDAPLDDVMLSLREKYVKMEAEYKKQIEALTQQNTDIKNHARVRELEFQMLNNNYNTVLHELEEWKKTSADHQATLLDHQLANEQMIIKLTNRLNKREKKLEKITDEYMKLKSEYKINSELWANDKADFQQKWDERDAEFHALLDELARTRELHLELQEKFRISREFEVLQQLNALQNEMLELENRLRKAELQREQAEQNKQSALSSLERCMEDIKQLQEHNTNLENQLRERDEQEERNRQSKTHWSSEVVHLQTQVAALADKANKQNAKYTDQKAKMKLLKEELIKTRTYLDELQLQVQDEIEAHRKTRDEEEKLNEANRELKRDLTMKTGQLTAVLDKFQALQTQYDSLRKDHDVVVVEHKDLKARAELAAALDQLKLHEFVSMAHSNLKVAGAIENLMGKIKKEEVEKKYRDAPLYDSRPSTGISDSRPSTSSTNITESTDDAPINIRPAAGYGDSFSL